MKYNFVILWIVAYKVSMKSSNKLHFLNMPMLAMRKKYLEFKKLNTKRPTYVFVVAVILTPRAKLHVSASIFSCLKFLREI